MITHIVACGLSAQHWPGTGTSIGINDAEKWGSRCTYLALFNHPSKFSREPERMKIITASRPKKVFTHAASWRQYFTDVEITPTVEYNNRIRPGKVYHKKTTPIIALCIAWNLGAKDIVLWGVDMVDHKLIRPGMKYYDQEVRALLSLTDQLKKYDVNVYVGAKGSVLCDHLPMLSQKVDI